MVSLDMIGVSAANGYVWNWKLYTGKEEDSHTTLSLAHRVVLDLFDDDRLQNKGYHVLTKLKQGCFGSRSDEYLLIRKRSLVLVATIQLLLSARAS